MKSYPYRRFILLLLPFFVSSHLAAQRLPRQDEHSKQAKSRRDRRNQSQKETQNWLKPAGISALLMVGSFLAGHYTKGKTNNPTGDPALEDTDDTRFQSDKNESKVIRIYGLLHQLTPELENKLIFPKGLEQHKFFDFIATAYLTPQGLSSYLTDIKRPLQTYQSSFPSEYTRKASQTKKLFGECLAFIIDLILEDTELFPTKASQKKQLTQLYHQLQACPCQSFHTIVRTYERLEFIKGDKLKPQILAALHQLKYETIEDIVQEKISNIDAYNKRIPQGHSKLYHLSNILIVQNHGKKLGVDQVMALSDPFLHTNSSLNKLDRIDYNNKLVAKIDTFVEMIFSDMNDATKEPSERSITKSAWDNYKADTEGPGASQPPPPTKDNIYKTLKSDGLKLLITDKNWDLDTVFTENPRKDFHSEEDSD